MDTAYAVALQMIESRTCGCGQDRMESLDSANEFAYKAEAFRCHACATRARAAEKFADNGGDQAGLLFAVTRKDDDG